MESRKKEVIVNTLAENINRFLRPVTKSGMSVVLYASRVVETSSPEKLKNTTRSRPKSVQSATWIKFPVYSCSVALHASGSFEHSSLFDLLTEFFAASSLHDTVVLRLTQRFSALGFDVFRRSLPDTVRPHDAINLLLAAISNVWVRTISKTIEDSLLVRATLTTTLLTV